MAIVIRHGSNGAMKSASAVGLYLIPAIKEGRTIVTNLRGFTLERCYQVYPDLPSDLEVININTENSEGKEKMARWFHWAPLGAMIVFDEASSLFPKAWRETQIRQLDYPGGQDQAEQDGRPADWVTAFEMHRHYNWDIVLTTPNIKNIRDDIRNTTEMAYRQRSLGKVASEKFRMYKEVQHDAVKNGFTLSDAIAVSTQRVPKDAFRLYDSTKTGIAQGSNAGKSMLANPKVLLLGGILVLAVAAVASTGGPSIAKEAPPGELVPIEGTEESRPVAVPERGPTPDLVPRRDVVRKQPSQNGFVTDPLAEHNLRLLGSFDGESQILATSDTNDKVIFTPKTLSKLGYAYFPVTPCIGRLEFKGHSRLVLCGSKQQKEAPSNRPDDSGRA